MDAECLGIMFDALVDSIPFRQCKPQVVVRHIVVPGHIQGASEHGCTVRPVSHLVPCHRHQHQNDQDKKEALHRRRVWHSLHRSSNLPLPKRGFFETSINNQSRNGDFRRHSTSNNWPSSNKSNDATNRRRKATDHFATVDSQNDFHSQWMRWQLMAVSDNNEQQCHSLSREQPWLVVD